MLGYQYRQVRVAKLAACTSYDQTGLMRITDTGSHPTTINYFALYLLPGHDD